MPWAASLLPNGRPHLGRGIRASLKLGCITTSTPSCSDQPLLLLCSPKDWQRRGPAVPLTSECRHPGSTYFAPLLPAPAQRSPTLRRLLHWSLASQVCTDGVRRLPAAPAKALSPRGEHFSCISPNFPKLSELVRGTRFGSGTACPDECPLCPRCPPAPLTHSVYSS